VSQHPPHEGFELTAAAVIVANSALLLFTVFNHDHEEAARCIELACQIFFTVELGCWLGWLGPRQFARRRWFDTAIILLAWLPVLGGIGITWVIAARMARIIHVGKHVSHLRLARLVALIRRREVTE
jgi:hypothetical protein